MKIGFTLFGMLILAAVLLSPFLFVWAWNILFGVLHYIPYTFKTWLAVLVLYAFFNGRVTYEKK